MRLLIAYDGSLTAKRAIEMLTKAGFAQTGMQVRVLAVEEPQVTAAPVLNLDVHQSIGAYQMEREREILDYAVETSEHVAYEGESMVRKIFPDWDINACSRVGSPAETILEMAAAWKPDLIVLGSHGRSTVQRLLMGSVSMRVMREANTAVRITRNGSNGKDGAPPVLLFAFDASSGASKVVRELLRRSWPDHTQLHIVSVIDVGILSTRNYLWLVGSDIAEYEKMNETRIEHAVHDLEHALSSRFDVTSSILIGSPVHEILNQARRLHADTVFLGSRGLSHLERLLLGSVVQGVASHVETTVEIIR